MKQWLYRIQPSRKEMLSEGPNPEEERIVGEHFAYLKRLTENGVVLLAGRTLNTDGSSSDFCRRPGGEVRGVRGRGLSLQRGTCWKVLID